MPNSFRTTCAVVCLLALLTSAWAQESAEGDFPSRDDSLHDRIAQFDEILRARHWNEGVVQTQVIFPPAGEERPITGNHEDVCGHTAVLLAAYSHRYAVTKDPKHRKLADDVMEGILTLERVTGVPGLVARGFYKTDKPLWHEKAYFFSNEWHDSASMPGYRWLGDLSSDKFTDLFYGVGTYWEICADEAHRQIAADFLDRFVGRCVDYNFKLVDLDGKMTLWGNFCPDLPHDNLNALEMLAGLKTVHRMTGKERYRAAYNKLIETYHYDDQAIMAKTLWPDEWAVPWDDNLAAKSYWMLMRYETDPTLLTKYRMALNRHLFSWKRLSFEYGAVPYYFMLYDVLTGDTVVDEDIRGKIDDMWPGHRDMRTFTVPAPDGPQRMESLEENINVDEIRNYWFARHYGFVESPEPLPEPQVGTHAWKVTHPEPSDDPEAPEGMVYVPAGPFIMGSNFGDTDESPQHIATTGAFFIDTYEVSHADFKEFDAGYTYPEGKENFPAVVTWEQANAYAAWAGKRLPTEAEWEKAARGIDGRLYPWGDTYDPTFIAYDVSIGRGETIAKPASPYGCYDMAGGAYEWTSSWYQPYPGNTVPCAEYGEKNKVMRGGSNFNDLSMMRTTHRYYLPPNTTGNYNTGFRCAKDVK